MTRPHNEPPPEPIQEGDFPVDEHGCFSPPYPEMWMLWRTMPSHGYKPGSRAEARAIERWRNLGGDLEWQLAGRPWAHSEWMLDPKPWRDALAALDGR